MGDSPRYRQEDEDRYAEINMEDDDFVLYDRENHQAWYQTDVTVDMSRPAESDYWQD